MIKRRIIKLLMMLIMMTAACQVCRAQDLLDKDDVEIIEPVILDARAETEEIDPDELLRTADELIFQRWGAFQNFSEVQGYVNEVLDGNIIHQYFVRYGKGTDQQLSMFPASRSNRATNLRLNLKDGYADEFHASLTLQRTEDMPERQGGRCWISYSNIVAKQRGSETGIIFFPGDQAYRYMPGDGNYFYESVADLSGLSQDEPIVFDFIRLDGVIYVYADKVFLFSLEDGLDGRQSFEAGSEIFEGGTRIRCDYDDFSMWIR